MTFCFVEGSSTSDESRCRLKDVTLFIVLCFDMQLCTILFVLKVCKLLPLQTIVDSLEEAPMLRSEEEVDYAALLKDPEVFAAEVRFPTLKWGWRCQARPLETSKGSLATYYQAARPAAGGRRLPHPSDLRPAFSLSHFYQHPTL